MRTNNLKEQDVVLALHLLNDDVIRRQVEYADELGISQAEISGGLKRLVRARLIDPELKLPYRKNLKEFLVYGLKYVFPAKLGAVAKGIVTAHSAPPLSVSLRSSGLPVIWPSELGEVQGHSVEPLYPSVPKAIQNNPLLYELLAVVDSLRLGKPRERAIAVEELEKRL